MVQVHALVLPGRRRKPRDFVFLFLRGLLAKARALWDIPQTAIGDAVKCIVCGQEGLPAVSQRVPIQPKGTVRKLKLRTANGEVMTVLSGDLAHANMVGPGPGSAPSDFPGDPTGKKYYGSGASAYRYFHPECVGQSLASYNAFLAAVGPQINDDEEWLYPEEKSPK
jgi:hypothetical protein